MNFDAAIERNFYRSRLITLVRANPLLWDKTTVDFNNRFAKIAKWEQVSVELGVSTGKIRRTWENLRDQFRRDLKRKLKYGTRPKWRFYDEMSFIRNMVRVKELNEAGGNSASDSEELDALQEEDYEHESLSAMISSNLISAIPVLEDMPSTSAAAAAAAGAGATSVIASTSNFQPMELSIEWQQNTGSDGGGAVLGKKDRREYQLAQLACRQMQQQARQQYDSMKQNQQIQRQQQQHQQQQQQWQRQLQQQQQQKRQQQQQLQQQLQLQQQQQLQEEQQLENQNKEYQQQQLQQQKCDSSEETKFDADYQVEISDMVKIEIESDSDDEDFMPSLSPADAKPEVVVPTSIEQKNPLALSEEACVTTSATTSSGALKRARQSDGSCTVKEDNVANQCELPDEDYHFVMSILPSLRQIARNRKFPLRMRIMDLISKELLEADEQDC